MKRSRASLSVLLAGLLVLSIVAPAFAASRSDLKKHQQAADSARGRAKQAEQAAKDLATQVEDLDQQANNLQSQANALEPKIADAAKRTDKLEAEVRDLQVEVDSTQADIAATQAEYTRQQELLKNRVREAYRQGRWFYLDILLGSEDIGDLITRTELVNRVINSNAALAENLQLTAEKLERAKVKLDRSLESVKVKKHEAAQVESNLRTMKAQRDQAAQQTRSVQDQKAKLMADNKANAKRLRALADQEEAESARIEAELAKASGSGEYGGIMAWPVPSSQRITSPFGWRICPYHGREMHPGIDIGAPQGSPIVAAGPGTVIYAGYRGSYGNTIMIDHGNGVVTLYAHQVSGGLKVSVGDRVERGQRIGTVGSTGNSTGPHTHFEVRVNGVPKNPMGYM